MPITTQHKWNCKDSVHSVHIEGCPHISWSPEYLRSAGFGHIMDIATKPLIEELRVVSLESKDSKRKAEEYTEAIQNITELYFTNKSTSFTATEKIKKFLIKNGFLFPKKKFYVTFGRGDVHIRKDKSGMDWTLSRNTVLIVLEKDLTSAIAKAEAMFGDNWATCFEEVPNMKYYKEGFVDLE